MEFRTGRLIDHVHLVVRDLGAAKRFYRAGAQALGVGFELREGPGFFSLDELFVSEGEAVSRVHLAFQAPDRDTVRRWHEAVLGAGGRDNGPPGERSYHPGYFAAFALDPDGNNLEAVFHGPTTRSAEAVIITPLGG
jgi:catechol 2,3-dioxygenase-like lactoylglutathione lyase family enzyme